MPKKFIAPLWLLFLFTYPFIVVFVGTLFGTMYESIFTLPDNYMGPPASIIIFPLIGAALATILNPIIYVIHLAIRLIRIKNKTTLFNILHISGIVLVLINLIGNVYFVISSLSVRVKLGIQIPDNDTLI